MMIHSIFLRITLFFALTYIAIAVGIFFLAEKFSEDQLRRFEKEGETLLLILRQSVALPPNARAFFLQEHGYRIAKADHKFIQSLQSTFTTVPPEYSEALKDSLAEGRIRILKDDRHFYVYLTKATPPLLVYKPNIAERSYFIETLFGVSSLLLLLLYWLIVKTLLPLKVITRTINRYGSDGVYIPLKPTTNDEIATVSRALDRAMEKNQSLLEARKLFLRNIMHELKTPITVGKLTLPFFKKGEEKAILERAFFRMEHLITELVRLEQITSGALAPHLQPCDPTHLIDKAKELLFLKNDRVQIDIDATPILADMDVMVTVFKNLIDNGIKYSVDGNITISQRGDVFKFCNRGNPWPTGCTFETLSKPFLHHAHHADSFGLGLYIVRSIVEAHNFTIAHRFEEGIHCFELACSSPLFSHG